MTTLPDWVGWTVIAAFVLFFALMARDLHRPSTLADKPQRPEFLDERQVRAARREAANHANETWIEELLHDTHAVEADRTAKRARGECSCTVPDTGPENCLIADRRCPIHGGFHD